MHAIHLAEMAAIFAQNATVQLTKATFPNRELSNSYWLATRFRHDQWSGQLARHRIEIQRPGVSHRLQCWNRINPLLQEILLAEPLARVMAYFGKLIELASRDATLAHQETSDFTSLSDTAFQSHTEARNRCLHLLVFGQGLPSEQAAKLNRVRQQLESYCDHLLAFLPFNHAVETYAFNPIDVAQVHESIHSDSDDEGESRRWHLVHLRQQLWLHHEESIDRRSANARLNSRLTKVALKAFPPEVFDGFGVPISSKFAKIQKPHSQDLSCCGALGDPIYKIINPQPARAATQTEARRF